MWGILSPGERVYNQNGFREKPILNSVLQNKSKDVKHLIEGLEVGSLLPCKFFEGGN